MLDLYQSLSLALAMANTIIALLSFILSIRRKQKEMPAPRAFADEARVQREAVHNKNAPRRR